MCKNEFSFLQAQNQTSVWGYIIGMYKLYPPKSSLRTQSILHSTSAYLHDISCKVNTKLIPITLVRMWYTYWNIHKHNQNKGSFFQTKYQRQFFSTQVPIHYFVQKNSKTNLRVLLSFSQQDMCVCYWNTAKVLDFNYQGNSTSVLQMT